MVVKFPMERDSALLAVAQHLCNSNHLLNNHPISSNRRNSLSSNHPISKRLISNLHLILATILTCHPHFLPRRNQMPA